MTAGRAWKFMKLLEVVYLLEAGAFLLLAPWSRLWIERVVTRAPSELHHALASPFFRGFIAGIGLLHLFFALRDLGRFRVAEALPPSPAPARSEP